MHQLGIIEYKPASDKPQLYLLQNRMYKDDFKLNYKNIATRKEEARKRILGITSFVKNEYECRSKMIANYFGDLNTKECGICDNCINTNAIQLTTIEFEEIAEKIIGTVKSGKHSIDQIIFKLKPLKKRAIWKVISYCPFF